MTFVQWAFLFGAAAVIGPVVAHLLGKPRFRRVPFTMLQFLRSGQRQRQARRRLRDLLVLLLRCVIVVLVAVLFAQPLLHVQAEPAKHKSVQWLALDDSMSMAYHDGAETLFDRMIATALASIRSASEDTTFHLWGLASGRSSAGLTKAQAMAEIKRLKPVPTRATFVDLFSALRQAGKTTPPDETLSLLLVSDFTPSVLQALERVSTPAVVDAVHFEHVAAREPVSNTAVLGARLAGAHGGKLSIDVTACHYGSAGRQCTLAASTPDLSPVLMENVTLAPGEPRVLRLQMDLGPDRQRPDRSCWPIGLSVTPDDNLREDNSYRLAAYVPLATASTNVVVASRGEEAFLFETALQALSASGSLDGLKLRRVPEDRLTASDLADADIAVFASVSLHLSRYVSVLEGIVGRGGRLVFFLGNVDGSDAARRLWRAGLLPALPERWVSQIVYPEPRQTAGTSLDLDSGAAKSLANYRVDRVALKGYWLCTPAAGAECLWRLTGGAPFLYGIKVGRGASLLVNTSIDGSLGLLAKSPAWVAFCRCLVGTDDRPQAFCFSAEERPVLHLPESPVREPRRTVFVENCGAGRDTASVRGRAVAMPAPKGIGWMETVDEPVLYAGINLPAGETDVRMPAAEVMADALQRAFVAREREGRTLAQAQPVVERRPVWRYLAWAAILLLLFEAALANRLRR